MFSKLASVKRIYFSLSERQRQRVRKKTAQKLETFLQEHPCDQTPKLPKCRDCRVVDKRDADQHAFCRFVMFRR